MIPLIKGWCSSFASGLQADDEYVQAVFVWTATTRVYA
jgi:hypothetical protein